MVSAHSLVSHVASLGRFSLRYTAIEVISQSVLAGFISFVIAVSTEQISELLMLSRYTSAIRVQRQS